MNRKILIIDQDDDLTASMERYLLQCNFEVTRVPDGMMGMQCSMRDKPDLIILDLYCPAGGALFMLQNLKRSLVTRNIPVLVVAGPSDPQMKRKLLELGLLTYVQKPFRQDELLARIH